MELNCCKDRSKFEDALKLAVRREADVKTLTTSIRLELLDLGILSSENEIKASIVQNYGEQVGDFKVFIFQPNKREQRKAFVSLKEEVGIKMLHAGRIRIGLGYSRVRKRVELQRCYRCMTFSHISRECTGPDLSVKCWRCGK